MTTNELHKCRFTRTSLSGYLEYIASLSVRPLQPLKEVWARAGLRLLAPIVEYPMECISMRLCDIFVPDLHSLEP